MSLRRGHAAAFEGHSFALCLTHDVDRPYKSVQAPYLATRDRNLRHLRDLADGGRRYWRFADIMAIEDGFDARSAFYFLNEQRITDLPPHRWIDPRNWLRFTGHYRIRDPAIASQIRALHRGGWEIGIHGSFESATDPDRFRAEKRLLEEVLDAPVIGGRQHFLNLARPASWRIHRDAGLRYDASLGSSREYGFLHGYDVKRPFDDGFLVFPLTVMEVALRREGRDIADACRAIDELVDTAAETGAVMTALWHVRLFDPVDFPGYRYLYRYLLRRAAAADAWMGPPAAAAARIAQVSDRAHASPHRRR